MLPGLGRFALFGAFTGGPVAIAYSAGNPGRVFRLVLHGTYAFGQEISTTPVRESLISLVRAQLGPGFGGAYRDLDTRCRSRLAISVRTAEAHLEHIRTKLKFRSWAQVAAWVVSPGRNAMASARPADYRPLMASSTLALRQLNQREARLDVGGKLVAIAGVARKDGAH